jgi:hypothetical protein
MAMSKDNVKTQYFNYISSKYPDYSGLDQSDLDKLIELILEEVKNAEINITVVNITNTTGLTAGGYPVIGTVADAGGGSAEITA